MTNIYVEKNIFGSIKSIMIEGHSEDPDVCGAISILIQTIGRYIEENIYNTTGLLVYDIITTSITLNLPDIMDYHLKRPEIEIKKRHTLLTFLDSSLLDLCVEYPNDVVYHFEKI